MADSLASHVTQQHASVWGPRAGWWRINKQPWFSWNSLFLRKGQSILSFSCCLGPCGLQVALPWEPGLLMSHKPILQPFSINFLSEHPKPRQRRCRSAWTSFICRHVWWGLPEPGVEIFPDRRSVNLCANVTSEAPTLHDSFITEFE